MALRIVVMRSSNLMLGIQLNISLNNTQSSQIKYSFQLNSKKIIRFYRSAYPDIHLQSCTTPRITLIICRCISVTSNDIVDYFAVILTIFRFTSSVEQYHHGHDPPPAHRSPRHLRHPHLRHHRAGALLGHPPQNMLQQWHR